MFRGVVAKGPDRVAEVWRGRADGKHGGRNESMDEDNSSKKDINRLILSKLPS